MSACQNKHVKSQDLDANGSEGLLVSHNTTGHSLEKLKMEEKNETIII